MKPKALSATEIKARLLSLNAGREPGWSHEHGQLNKEFAFPDFVAAFGFMTRVALVAERANHHPNWSNVYNRVVVGLSTHEASGVSEADFRLAGEMDALFEPGTPSTASAPSG